MISMEAPRRGDLECGPCGARTRDLRIKSNELTNLTQNRVTEISPSETASTAKSRPYASEASGPVVTGSAQGETGAMRRMLDEAEAGGNERGSTAKRSGREGEACRAGETGAEDTTGCSTLDSKKSKCCELALPASLSVQYSDRRRRRWAARGALWKASSRAGVRACGRLPRVTRPGDDRDGRSGGDMIGLVTASDDRPAGFRGLNRCASVWACPRCSSQIALERSKEIAGALRYAHINGGRSALLTLTVRHTGADSLEEVWNAVSAGWRSVTGGYG